MKIAVYHRGYGCDTGCCGHTLVIDGQDEIFEFEHPYGRDHKEFAKDLVKDVMGEEHVEDLDWENSVVLDE